MKSLKTKLVISISMLLIAAIMMTSVSYAWFTLSTNPEITEATATVVTNENLEIALLNATTSTPTDIPGASQLGDTTKYDTWGNLINLSGIITEDTLRPATYDSTAHVFQYPSYGTDGRPNTLTNLSTETSFGYGNLTDDKNNVYGYYVDFWVRSNVGGTLKLQAATNTQTGTNFNLTGADRNTNGEKGSGTYFKSAELEVKDATATDYASYAGKKLAYEALAENIRIGFKDITPASVTNATAAASDATMVVATCDYKAEQHVEDTTANSDVAKKIAAINYFTCDSICELTANEAKLIRMYVYLEGENVTNAAASLESGTAFTNEGTLNVQFTMDNVEKSMEIEKKK